MKESDINSQVGWVYLWPSRETEIATQTTTTLDLVNYLVFKSLILNPDKMKKYSNLTKKNVVLSTQHPDSPYTESENCLPYLWTETEEDVAEEAASALSDVTNVPHTTVMLVQNGEFQGYFNIVMPENS